MYHTIAREEVSVSRKIVAPTKLVRRTHSALWTTIGIIMASSFTDPQSEEDCRMNQPEWDNKKSKTI